MRNKWDELREWATDDLALHTSDDEPNCNCQRCYVSRQFIELLDENEALREALNELKRAARAWDECPDTMPMDVYARVRGEFDAALGDAHEDARQFLRDLGDACADNPESWIVVS